MAEIRTEVRVWITENDGSDTTVDLEASFNVGDNPRFLPQLATSQMHHLASEVREMLVAKFGDIAADNTPGQENKA